MSIHAYEIRPDADKYQMFILCRAGLDDHLAGDRL